MLPRYRFPPGALAAPAAAMLFGGRRSFHADALKLARGISSLSVDGEMPDPASAPRGWVLTSNHYSRPGYGAWWSVIALSAAFPLDIHWLTTSKLRRINWHEKTTLEPVSAWFLRRLARVYDFTTMPPMPPRPDEQTARALALRRLLEYVRAAERPVLGIAPEGADASGPSLMRPFPGAGKLLAHLARQGLTILPVGIYEQGDTMRLRFGLPYSFDPDALFTRDQLDAGCAEYVMQRIAACLPESMRAIQTS